MAKVVDPPRVVPLQCSADDIDFCSVCDFVAVQDGAGEESARVCFECFCMFCGRWQCPHDSSDPLSQCAVCPTAPAPFGLARLHVKCLAQNAATSRRRSIAGRSTIACRACKSVIYSVAPLTTSALEDVPTSDGAAPHDTTAVPITVKQEPNLSEDVVEADDKDGLKQHPSSSLATPCPNLLRALMCTDPRQASFETIHYGALRLGLIALQRFETGESGSCGSDAVALPEHELVESVPQFPIAALRLSLEASPWTGELRFVLPVPAAPTANSSRRKRERSWVNTAEEDDDTASQGSSVNDPSLDGRGGTSLSSLKHRARQQQRKGGALSNAPLTHAAPQSNCLDLDVSLVTQYLSDQHHKKSRKSPVPQPPPLARLVRPEVLDVLEQYGLSDAPWAHKRKATVPSSIKSEEDAMASPAAKSSALSPKKSPPPSAQFSSGRGRGRGSVKHGFSTGRILSPQVCLLLKSRGESCARTESRSGEPVAVAPITFDADTAKP